MSDEASEIEAGCGSGGAWLSLGGAAYMLATDLRREVVLLVAAEDTFMKRLWF